HACYPFFFNDTATTEIYTLSLHDALPISRQVQQLLLVATGQWSEVEPMLQDRKSTRLNSSHVRISYAVFCLKKKAGGSHSRWNQGQFGWPVVENVSREAR